MNVQGNHNQQKTCQVPPPRAVTGKSGFRGGVWSIRLILVKIPIILVHGVRNEDFTKKESSEIGYQRLKF